ncbi:MAG TPA: ectoine hydroxylase [Acidimicrobiales bacterium]|nr:ectoine hydroxylase [Acidimicrobiales bacterium]
MIVRTLDDVEGTDRAVDAPTFVSRRLLLARDGTDFSLHDTTLHGGTSTTMEYRHHVEAVYCLSGEGEVEDLTTGRCWAVRPGLLYVVDVHERHELRATTDLRVLCVFTPPLVGPEVHDRDGVYPRLTPSGAADRYPTRTGAKPVLLPRLDPVVHDWDGPGPLDTAQLESFERDGFLHLAGLFSPDEVAAMRGEMLALAGRPALRDSGRLVIEPAGDVVRSVFEVHRLSEVFGALAADPRLAGPARQLLGSDVYVQQSRVNYKPGFGGEGFYWHSDFETWHAEDGLPAMRTVSFSIALTDNLAVNGPLMIIPGSHRTFVACAGETPPDHYRQSLRNQQIGTPDDESLGRLVEEAGEIRAFTGEAGGVTVFDCNCMHGSGSNISPHPRSNVFMVYNSVENLPVEPFAAPARRPPFVAARDFTPV